MTILITGANRGIGHALAAHYTKQNQAVVSTARRPGPGQLELDVTDRASHQRLAAGLNGKPIDLLICNAGVYLDKGHSLETGFGPEVWAEAFAANVTGVFLTIQSLLPNLRAAQGKVAIISSIMASSDRAPGGSYAYRASKAAALNLGRNLAKDLLSDGIAVGIYHPGWVRTEMGGSDADIDVDAAVSGLTERFGNLSVAQTGEFLSYDGQPLSF